MIFAKNKKGQIENWIGLIVFLLFFGITAIIGYVFMDNYIDAYKGSGFYTGVIEQTGEKFLNAMKLYDGLIVILMVALIIGLALTNLKLAAHPAFFVVTFIMAGFYGFVSYFFNVIFVQLVSDPIFTSALAFFPNTILICTNLHWVMLITIVVGSITLYAKKPKGQFIE